MNVTYFRRPNGSPFKVCGYVARLLGDTIKVVEENYIPFVRELREGARLKIGSGRGIEQFETPASQQDSDTRLLLS